MANNRYIPKLKILTAKALRKHSLFSADVDFLLDSLDLAQAEINNDVDTMQRLLTKNPALVLHRYDEEHIDCLYPRMQITVSGECPLSIAVKLKNLKMVELCLDAYDKIHVDADEIERKFEILLSCWHSYFAAKDNQEINTSKYKDTILGLIEVFKQDSFPSTVFRHLRFQGFNFDFLKAQTKLALTTLFDTHEFKLTNLDELDPLLFFTSLCKIYAENMHELNKRQQTAFSTLIIGFAERILPLHIIQLIWPKCHFYGFIDPPIQRSTYDIFFRESPTSFKGLGFDYAFDLWGGTNLAPSMVSMCAFSNDEINALYQALLELNVKLENDLKDLVTKEEKKEVIEKKQMDANNDEQAMDSQSKKKT